jgi:stage II sporulation protein D
MNHIPFIKLTFLIFMLLISCNSEETKFTKSSLFSNKEPNVRVRIINTPSEITIRFLDNWGKYFEQALIHVSIEDDKIFVEGMETQQALDSLILESKKDHAQLEIKNVPYGVGWWWEGKEDRVYEGKISIYKGENKNLEVIVELPLEEYLKGVVPYEIGGDSPIEALKAQTVAARSEAVVALTSNLYRGKHHDLTSDVECQVFSGNKKRTANSDNAVVETRGIILSVDGKPINAYYASNCGGHSEYIKNVWPDRPEVHPYQYALSDTKERTNLDLSSKEKVRDWIFSEPDVFCNPNLGTALPDWSKNNFRWRKEFTTDEISKMISGEKDFGKLLDIQILNRGASGRIYSAKFIFENEELKVDGELAIRQLFKPSLRSSCFVVDIEEKIFILNGAGWGHGVGMCQSGAVAQAKQGVNFKNILHHYYENTDLLILY